MSGNTIDTAQVRAHADHYGEINAHDARRLCDRIDALEASYAHLSELGDQYLRDALKRVDVLEAALAPVLDVVGQDVQAAGALIVTTFARVDELDAENARLRSDLNVANNYGYQQEQRARTLEGEA